MRKISLLSILLLLCGALILNSCGGVKKNVQDYKGEAIDEDWSAEDLKKVSLAMVDSVSNAKFTKSAKYVKDKPRWMLSRELANDTDEHINTRVIIEKIRTKLINNQVGIFIDDLAVDEALKQQELQQSDLYDNKKAAQVGKMVGAKLILRGRISNIRKQDGRTGYNSYNITLQVVDLETTQILWTDEYEMGRKATKNKLR